MSQNATNQEIEPLESPFPEWGTKGMAVSDHRAASEAACQILKEGGNAVDAAVTLSLTLGVVCPQYTGIGGGGFALVHLPEMERASVIDFRETAPSRAHPDMFGGEELTSIYGGLAPGIPGTVAGLSCMLEEFGTISWERALTPGIELARGGVDVCPNLRRVVMGRQEKLKRFPDAAKLFFSGATDCLSPGNKLFLPELADTYERMAKNGAREFYEGETAERIVAGVKRAGGIFELKDLAGYFAIQRTPLEARYKRRDFATIGPPSGGGIQLLQMLRMLEAFDLGPSDHPSAEAYHLQAEAMRLSFADRSSWVADPAFFEVPVEAMLNEERLQELQARIQRDRAMDFVETPALQQRMKPEGHNLPGVGGTAAYAVADSNGGYVVATESVNLWFGSMVVPAKTGILLNNVMDDFSRKPGTPDAFGLVSSRVNQVEPGKRPASSAAPTLVTENGKVIAALASAGGPRIATTVLQMAINYFDHALNIRHAMDAPRIHHQWLPRELVVENTVAKEVRERLEEMGHTVVLGPNKSHAGALVWDEARGCFFGAGDFRSGGVACGFS